MRIHRTDLTMVLLTLLAVLGHAFTGCCAHHLHAQQSPQLEPAPQISSASTIAQIPFRQLHSICGCNHQHRPHAVPESDPAQGKTDRCQHLPCDLVADVSKSLLAGGQFEFIQQVPPAVAAAPLHRPPQCTAPDFVVPRLPVSADRLRAQLCSWLI